MKPGSVVVDLAAESGGNVEGSVAGVDVVVPLGGASVADGAEDPSRSVTLVGMKDTASTMPADASRLYARNVANFLLLMTKDGEVIPDFDDEVVAGTCLTHDGVVVHAPTAEALGDPGPTAAAAAAPGAGDLGPAETGSTETAPTDTGPTDTRGES